MVAVAFGERNLPSSVVTKCCFLISRPRLTHYDRHGEVFRRTRRYTQKTTGIPGSAKRYKQQEPLIFNVAPVVVLFLVLFPC